MRNKILADESGIAGASACRLQRPAGHRHRRAELRAFADPAGAAKFLDADGQCRHRDRLAGRRQADRRQRHGGQCLRHRARSSAHVMSCPMATCWCETNAPPKPTTTQGHCRGSRDHENDHGPRRSARGKRRTHHAAARCRRRRRRRDQKRLSRRAESPFGMALVGDDFYVADTDAIMKFPYHCRRHQNRRRPA